MNQDKRGPGLARARELPLVRTHRTVLTRAEDSRWAALLETADTLSEGTLRDENDRRVWYGSTSFIVPIADRKDLEFLVAVIARDLHVRLRAVRIACREAGLRAPSRLSQAQCEIKFAVDSRGLRIDVDVQAPLIRRGVGRVSAKRT